MFYIYMIISVIISLVLIGIACVAPMFILKEFDKIKYIKGYKNELKWYKKPLLYLQNILVYTFFILSIGLLLLVVLFNHKDKLKLLKKQFYVVYSSMFVTPLIGIGLTYLLVSGFNMVLYYFEMTVILAVFNVICNMLPYVVITYYLILIFKQLKNIFDFEKQQLSDQYSEFWNGNKKESVNLVLLSQSSNKYIDDYLLICDSEEMWKSSEYNVLNYNYMCIQLFKLYSLVTIINCILFFIGGHIYDSGNYKFLQARLSMRACAIITGSLITIFCLNWLFNQEIILSFKNKQKLTAQSFTMFILSVVIGVMGIGILITSMLDNSYRYVSGYEYNYKEFKSAFVHKVEVNRDYLSYNDYEKVDYIFRYPHHFEDDAESLNYGYDYLNGNQEVNFFVYFPVENSELIDSANKYYGEELNYSILITEFIRTYATLDVVSNLDDNRKNKMILDPYDAFSVNINEANRQDHDYEFKTEEEVELGLLVKEEALKVTNSLWDEEMKDRGLI